MSGINNTIAILLIASGVMLIGGLIVIPAIQEAQAANVISNTNNKGKQGESASGGNRQDIGGGGGGGCPVRPEC